MEKTKMEIRAPTKNKDICLVESFPTSMACHLVTDQIFIFPNNISTIGNTKKSTTFSINIRFPKAPGWAGMQRMSLSLATRPARSFRPRLAKANFTPPMLVFLPSTADAAFIRWVYGVPCRWCCLLWRLNHHYTWVCCLPFCKKTKLQYKPYKILHLIHYI